MCGAKLDSFAFQSRERLLDIESVSLNREDEVVTRRSSSVSSILSLNKILFLSSL